MAQRGKLKLVVLFDKYYYWATENGRLALRPVNEKIPEYYACCGKRKGV